MLRTSLAAAALTAVLTLPAHAGSVWDERVDLCAAALADQGLIEADAYRAKFKTGGGGGVKKVRVTLIPKDGGDRLTAQCKIKRGEVVSAELKA